MQFTYYFHGGGEPGAHTWGGPAGLCFAHVGTAPITYTVCRPSCRELLL